jgi:hypothetical protein
MDKSKEPAKRLRYEDCCRSPRSLDRIRDIACFTGRVSKYEVSLSVLSTGELTDGEGSVAANLSINDTESGVDCPLRTVGGNWHGSPNMTSDRQLFVEVTGINVAGSTLWHASINRQIQTMQRSE